MKTKQQNRRKVAGGKLAFLVSSLGSLLVAHGALAQTQPLVQPRPGALAQQNRNLGAPAAQPPGAVQPPAAANQLPVELPAPNPVAGQPLLPFAPNQVRMQRMGNNGQPGRIPPPLAIQQGQAEPNPFIKDVVQPANSIEVVVTRTSLLRLKKAPKRVQIANPAVASYVVVAPTELSILGERVGVTVLTLWFEDEKDKAKETSVAYAILVEPDQEIKERVERIYKELEKEINRAFPESRVTLVLVGDKLMVTGQAKSMDEANQIMHVVRANSPLSPQDRNGANAARVPVDLVQPDDASVLEQGNTPRQGQGQVNFEAAGARQVINMLRVPGDQQVQLQVTVAEVDRSAGRSIGLNFNIFNNGGLQVGASTTGQIRPALGLGIGNTFTSFTSNGGLGNVVPQGVLNNLPVALDNGQIQLAINALRELHYAKTLAEPALVAMNGQTANFQAGGLLPLPYVTGYTNYGLQGVNFMPIGVQLNFTPYILGRDRLRLQVSAEVSERDLTLGATIINGSAVPALSTRNFQTTVELQEGQTLAVAGLLQNRAAGNSSRTPFLADIPIVNRLTGIDRVQSSEQELVILVTPRLVGPMDPEKVGPLPGNDLFEPSNIEFYLLGRIESRRNKDYRAPVMTDMHRRLNYLKCQEFYMNGPTGHAASAPLIEE